MYLTQHIYYWYYKKYQVVLYEQAGKPGLSEYVVPGRRGISHRIRDNLERMFKGRIAEQAQCTLAMIEGGKGTQLKITLNRKARVFELRSYQR